MGDNFWNRVQTRAYYKYLNRKIFNLPENSLEDWCDAEREESLENKIAEEAYFNYTKGYKDSDLNWMFAKNDVMGRLEFLAFYLHERDINKSPLENWVEAQKIYIENF